MPKDLRSFLAELESTLPEEVCYVDREVDPEFELPAVLRKLQDENRYPAVFFNKVKGSKFPVLSNLFASSNRLALAFGIDADNRVEGYLAKEDRLKASKTVRKAPVHENVFIGRKADLTKLPVITHCEKDAGPYLTSAVCIVKDHDSGAYDLGIFRLQLKSRNRLAVLYGAASKAARLITKNEQEGKPTEIALFVGHHPAAILSSQTKVPFGVDEFAVTGGVLGEPVELVQAKTVDVRVPAHAEFVIEGRLRVDDRESEGPFGEYPWYYGPERKGHIMDVTAITHRNDAIYHDVFSAHRDHKMCAKIQREAVVYKRVRMAIPGVKAVCLPVSGACRHVAYLSMRKDFDGQGKIAALAALAADTLMKMVVVVDDDIDVENESEVWWAVTTRTQADRAIFMVPESYVGELDPSSHSLKDRNERGYLNTKWAIDATKPVGIPFEERADVPSDVWSSMDLGDYLKG